MRRWGWIVVALAAGAWDPVTRKAQEVETGNQSYAAGDYQTAEKKYREAEKRLPGEPALHFDLGAALHRQALALPPGKEREQRLEEAEKALRLSLDAPDARLRSRSHYNLGNTLFERGRYGEAVEEYKKSLKLDAASEDARYNLELALRLQKQPPPQQQPQPRPDQKPEQQPEPQPPQPPQQPEQKPPEGKPEQSQEQQPKASEGEEKQPQPRDLSEADIERKLRELERRSKDLQVQKAAERAGEQRQGKQVKDW